MGALLAFIVAAAVMSLLIFSLALAIWAAQEQLITWLKAHTQQVKRWSSAILFLVGAWLLALAIWAGAFARLFPV